MNDRVRVQGRGLWAISETRSVRCAMQFGEDWHQTRRSATVPLTGTNRAVVQSKAAICPPRTKARPSPFWPWQRGSRLPTDADTGERWAFNGMSYSESREELNHPLSETAQTTGNAGFWTALESRRSLSKKTCGSSRSLQQCGSSVNDHRRGHSVQRHIHSTLCESWRNESACRLKTTPRRVRLAKRSSV